MKRMHPVLVLVVAVALTTSAAPGQETSPERLGEVEAVLAEIQELMGDLLRDNDVAKRIVEQVRAELHEALSEEQMERMHEIVQQYRHRLEQNSHWMERLESHKDRLHEWHRRLHDELAPVQERLRGMDMEERIAHIDEIAGAIAASFQGERHRPDRRQDRERELVIGQIETLHMALPPLREEQRHDAIDVIERAIHARKMILEGRNDREARMIRERTPHREQIVEIMAHAANIYREYGDHERAEKLRQLTERLWPGREPRERDSRRRYDDRTAADLQTMEQAMHALREAERTDAADLMRRALEARILELEGVRGREADRVREGAPDLEQTVELLKFASHLWDEFGREERARATRELAERMMEGRRERSHETRERSRRRTERDEHAEHREHELREHAEHRETREHSRHDRLEHADHRESREHDRRDRAESPEHREAVLHRIEVLQERLAEMREMIGHMLEELQELKHLAR